MYFNIKLNDTSPALKVQLLDYDEDPVVITGAVVRFHMTNSVGNQVLIDDSATIEDSENGIVYYQWKAGDTEKSGEYKGEFEVTFSDGKIETFPNDSDIKIKVNDDLS